MWYLHLTVQHGVVFSFLFKKMCVDFQSKLSGVTNMRQEFMVCQIKSHFSIVCRFSLLSQEIIAKIGFHKKKMEVTWNLRKSASIVLIKMKTAMPWLLEGINGLYIFSLLCYYATLTAAATKTKPIGNYDDRNLRLSSTAPQRRRQSVCRQRWQSFATLPTDCYWGVNAAMPYCGCILIPLLPVGRLVGRSEIKVAGL